MKKTFIVTIALAFVVVAASAQTENTSERLITQLKTGTAPGLLFARNVPEAKIEAKPVEQKESLIAQIRKGTAAGMKFMTGPAGNAALRTMPIAAQTQSTKLASDQEIKKEAARTIAAPPAIPTQEEVKQENKQ